MGDLTYTVILYSFLKKNLIISKQFLPTLQFEFQNPSEQARQAPVSLAQIEFLQCFGHSEKRTLHQ